MNKTDKGWEADGTTPRLLELCNELFGDPTEDPKNPIEGEDAWKRFLEKAAKGIWGAYKKNMDTQRESFPPFDGPRSTGGGGGGFGTSLKGLSYGRVKLSPTGLTLRLGRSVDFRVSWPQPKLSLS